MTDAAAPPPAALRTGGAPPAAVFALTVFCSALLVFTVQPLAAKLLLPSLGGAPAVWNTCLAFFQIALLAGYAYAHALQRISSLRTQALVHGGLLLLAMLALPLRVTGVLGDPPAGAPILWLLGVLAVSLGALFAVLSATAPLVQAWVARTRGGDPYPLYAASNLGSLLSLLAYPVLVEPTLRLPWQTGLWSAAYVAFALLMGGLALGLSRVAALPAPSVAAAAVSGRRRWGDRAVWILLAAAPSSLMLGVTQHLTTDIASAPFLWVAPLALYLLTFIIAFQARPWIAPPAALFLQALLVLGVAAVPTAASSKNYLLQLAQHLLTFFFTALVCHQALSARRPEPGRLTDFYLCLSVGGVVGGGFNAFLAPVLFDLVVEYPLVLVLALLARPWGLRDWRSRWGLLSLGILAASLALSAATWKLGSRAEMGLLSLFVGGAAAGAFLLRNRAPLFAVAVAAILLSTNHLGGWKGVLGTWRSFFGVVRVTAAEMPALGETYMLAHGSTLHGAQSRDLGYRCRPLTYYAPETPIGQVATAFQATPRPLTVGVVGLGTGTMAAYSRPGDRLTFFEIDPEVVRIASDPRWFDYTTRCAGGAVDYDVGDARLTLAKRPGASFDYLLIDAFSSDAVPTHLLTEEAVRGYLAKLRPGGVLVLHLTNRNLDLLSPAAAVAARIGAPALAQQHRKSPDSPVLWESAEDVLILANRAEDLDRFRADGRWRAPESKGARPWTDDYVNLLGALLSHFRERQAGRG